MAPSVPPGPGGFARAFDEAYNSQLGRVNPHREEYAWQVDNLLIRVVFQGLPAS